MQRKIVFTPGQYYHLYNTGIDGRKIFNDHQDYQRFMRLLYICNGDQPVSYRASRRQPLDKIKRGRSQVDLSAYCLMPNHFHLLIHEQEVGGVTQFMGKLLTAYSMYFNKRSGREGRLFRNCFRAEHIADEVYLRYLFAHIHLNPVKLINQHWKDGGLVDIIATKRYLANYPYSSYLDYLLVKREENIIINRGAFPAMFAENKDFVDELAGWLIHAQPEDHSLP
jgi:putative transposase